MKASKVLLNIMSVVCFIYGALYVFTLVFIPVGIYCFIAGRRFSYKADHVDDVFALDNKTFKAYVIIASIFCFPFGLLSIIPFYLLTSNKVKIETVQKEDPSSEDVQTEKVGTSNETPEPVQDKKEETLAEKREKYEKLKKFNEKGLITDDELEQAYNQLFPNGEN